MERLGDYEWLALTSPAGVDALWRWLEDTGWTPGPWAGVKLAAIGPGTAKALSAHGLRADYVPEVYDAAHLGEGMPAAGRVLILRAQEGSPALTEALERRNIGFDDVATYRTVYDNPRSEELRAAVESGAEGIGHLHQRLHREGLRVLRGGGRGLLPHGGSLHRGADRGGGRKARHPRPGGPPGHHGRPGGIDCSPAGLRTAGASPRPTRSPVI